MLISCLDHQGSSHLDLTQHAPAPTSTAVTSLCTCVHLYHRNFLFQVVERVCLGSPRAFLEPVPLWGLTSILGLCQLQLKTPNRWKSIWTSCAATSHGTRAYQVNQHTFFSCSKVWVGLQFRVKSSANLAVSYDLQIEIVVATPLTALACTFFPSAEKRAMKAAKRLHISRWLCAWAGKGCKCIRPCSTRNHWNVNFLPYGSSRTNMARIEILISLCVLFYSTGRFDTVLMNPPFGTRRAGIDVIFLERALEVSVPFRRMLCLVPGPFACGLPPWSWSYFENWHASTI